MELDEALVRQQLAARGVPADSIPDEVLRQVLRDFKELDVGEDGAAPLSYPTALAPQNGFYDRRYTCDTKDLEEIEDEDGFPEHARING